MTPAFLMLSLIAPSYSQETDDLKRDMIALELYLQDQKDHKEYCPGTIWKQPHMDVYKKKLKSQLPEGCKE